MPIVPLFTSSQILGNPDTLVITDTSTGSDAAIMSRVVYLLKYDGTYLLNPTTGLNYTVWDYADASISLAFLDADTTLTVTVRWLGVTNNILYTKTGFAVCNMYASMQDDFLISAQQANPGVVNNTTYYMNRIKLRVAINDAINSITNMSDVTNSQQACDRGMYFVDNQSVFF